MLKQKSKIQSVADIISNELPAFLKDKMQDATRLRQGWPLMVGPHVASRSRVVSIERKRLVVGVTSSVWMTELGLQKDLILEKLKQEFPEIEINELKLKLETTRP